MAPRTEPTHSVVFTAAFKDRILAQGRRRGMQIPYWLEVLTKRFYPQYWDPDHTARTRTLGPHFKYVEIARIIRESDSSGRAPKRAATTRARP